MENAGQSSHATHAQSCESASHPFHRGLPFFERAQDVNLSLAMYFSVIDCILGDCRSLLPMSTQILLPKPYRPNPLLADAKVAVKTVVWPSNLPGCSSHRIQFSLLGSTPRFIKAKISVQ